MNGHGSADTSAMIEDLERVRERVRRDQRPASIPLTVLTATMVLFTAMRWWGWATNNDAWTDPFWFWVIAAPIGFTVAGRWYQKLERDLGVSTQRIFGTLAVAALVSLLVFPLLAFNMLGIPYVVLGAVFLVVGVSQRSAYLIAGALIFGVGGALANLHVIGNRLYDVVGFVSWASPISWTLVTVLLAGVTALAWREEVGT